MHPSASREIIISRLYDPGQPGDYRGSSVVTTIDAYLTEIASQPEPSFHITGVSFDLLHHYLVCALSKAQQHFAVWTVHDFATINSGNIGLGITPGWKPLSIHRTYEAARRDMQTRKPPRRRAKPDPVNPSDPANGTSATPSVLPTEPHSPCNNNPTPTQEQT